MKIGVSKRYLYYKIPQRIVFSFVYGLLVFVIGLIILALTYWLFALLVYKKEAMFPSEPAVYILIYALGVIGRLVYEVGSIWLAYKGSTLEITKHTVEIVGAGFKKIAISYPLEKISLAVVNQSIVERIFRVGTIVISGEFSENTTFIGAPISDANAFVKQLLDQRKK